MPEDTRPVSVLFVEDSPDDMEPLLRELGRGGLTVAPCRVDSEPEMAGALARAAWDLVISDHAMPGFSSARALEILRRNDADTPFIIVTGRMDEADAVEAMKAGAEDYIWKDNLARLVPAVRRALSEAAIRREQQKTRELLRRSAAQHRHILELCPDAILIESEMRITFANQAAARLLGANIPAQLVGRDLLTLVAEDSRAAVAELAARPGGGGAADSGAPARWLRLDGAAVEAEAAANPFSVDGIPGAQIVLRPARPRTEPPVAAQGDQPELSPDAGATRRLGAWRHALGIGTAVFAAIFGVTELEELASSSVARESMHVVVAGLAAIVSGFVSYAVLRRRQEVLELLVAENAQRRKTDLEVQRANRELERRVSERTRELRDSNEQLHSELLQRRDAEQRLDRMAHYDNLTGIPNRALFFDRLSAQVASSRRENARFAVLFMDLDRFKSINDTLGHDVGDGLLEQAASGLRAAVRDSDTVARLGGDEFALILPALKHDEDAAVVARKILNSFSRPVRVRAHELYVTA